MTLNYSLTHTPLTNTNYMTRTQAFFLLSSATNGNELLALLNDIQDGYPGPKRPTLMELEF